MIDSKFIAYTTISLLALSSALSGCTTAQSVPERELMKPVLTTPTQNDGGVVILESTVVGETSAITAHAGDSDCTQGSGLGVMTSGSSGENRYLFDREGTPCDAAETLYDGKLKVYQRAADPTVNISFVDKYGAKPEPVLEILPSFASEMDVDVAKVNSPEDFALTGQPMVLGDAKEAVAQEAPLQGQGDDFQKKLATLASSNMNTDDWDYQKMMAENNDSGRQQELNETIQAWHQERERQELMKNAEKLFAGARTLERKSSHEMIAEHQEEISTLMARLREAEKMQNFQREREKMLQEQLMQTQMQVQAQQQDRTQTEQQLQQQVSVMEQRARDYKKMAQELKEDKTHNEEMLRQRISSLKKQLNSAEKTSDASQQKLLLDAAQQPHVSYMQLKRRNWNVRRNKNNQNRHI